MKNKVKTHQDILVGLSKRLNNVYTMIQLNDCISAAIEQMAYDLQDNFPVMIENFGILTPTAQSLRRDRWHQVRVPKIRFFSAKNLILLRIDLRRQLGDLQPLSLSRRRRKKNS